MKQLPARAWVRRLAVTVAVLGVFLIAYNTHTIWLTRRAQQVVERQALLPAVETQAEATAPDVQQLDFRILNRAPFPIEIIHVKVLSPPGALIAPPSSHDDGNGGIVVTRGASLGVLDLDLTRIPADSSVGWRSLFLLPLPASQRPTADAELEFEVRMLDNSGRIETVRARQQLASQ